MSSLDEQLALFEQEISSVVEEDKDAKAEQPIQAPDIGGSSVQSTTTTRFVPHQLRQKASQPAPTSHQVPPVNAARFPHSHSSVPNAHLSSGLASSATIESGPTLYSVLYAPASTTSSKASSSAAAKSAEPSSSSANPASSSLQQQQFKTLALPSDVELLLAKKQASKAHENSYLGAVLRGEKKMKRFVRSCGGQVWEDASMAEWDPNDFRIFCGDLGNEVSDELLAKAFRKYPSFQKAKVVRDNRTNKSKGYGFVSFRSQEDFIRAMKEMDGKYVGNRPIKLRKSNWKDRNVDIVKKKNKEKKKLGLI